MPRTGDTLQGILSPVLELEARTGYEVDDRARHKDLTGRSQRAHALADVDGDTAHVLAKNLDLPGMKSGACFDTESTYGITNGARTSNCPRGTVERCEDSVPGRFHEPAAMATEFFGHDLSVALKDLAPTLIAKLGDRLRRADEISE